MREREKRMRNMVIRGVKGEEREEKKRRNLTRIRK